MLLGNIAHGSLSRFSVRSSNKLVHLLLRVDQGSRLTRVVQAICWPRAELGHPRRTIDLSNICGSHICDASCWANTPERIILHCAQPTRTNTYVRGSHLEIRTILNRENLHLTCFVQQKEVLVAGATTTTDVRHLQQSFSSSKTAAKQQR